MTGAHRRSGILDQAAELNRLGSVLDAAFENRQRDPESWSRAADAFKAALAAFYEPLEQAAAALRDSDTELETALRFLEVDPWCFRSGYMKQKLLRRVARWARTSGDRVRLQGVVLLRVRNPQPGLLEPTGRIAARVWSEELHAAVLDVMRTGAPHQQDAARRLLDRVAELRGTTTGDRVTE